MDWFEKFRELMFPVDPNKMNIEGAFLLKQKSLPKTIFKYREVNEYSLKNLEEDTIWLSSPKNFNDPYDCSHCADYAKLSSKLLSRGFNNLPNISEIKKYIDPKTFNAIQASNDPYNEFMRQMDILVAKEYPDKANEIKNAFKDLKRKLYEDLSRVASERIKDSFKVCSFTRNRDSILMWSHYASLHQGFCIEYDISKYSHRDYLTRFLYPIIYSERMLDVTKLMEFSMENDNFNNLYYSLSALVKSKEWEYEQEWRLVFGHGVFEEDRAYPVNKPKTIFLGTKISHENQQILIDIATRKGIDVFKMKLESNSFKLVPTTVEDADQYFLK